MADPKFEYPDTTTPTTTIEFPKGGFKGDVPAGIREFNQSTDKSEAGEYATMSHGDNPRRFPFNAYVAISTQSGNTADIDKIDTFIDSTINGSLAGFYYTPRDGATAFHVRLMNPDSILIEELVNYHHLRFDLLEII